jgi:hypothetical protein
LDKHIQDRGAISRSIRVLDTFPLGFDVKPSRNFQPLGLKAKPDAGLGPAVAPLRAVPEPSIGEIA